MKPIIIRQVPIRTAMLYSLSCTVIHLNVLLMEQKYDFVYFVMLVLSFIFGLTAWYFSKVLEISEDTLIFKNGILAKYHSILLTEIESISPHYVGGSLLYLNIVLKNGETIKMTTISDEVLKLLEEKNLMKSTKKG